MKLYKLNEICDVRDGTHDSPKYVQNGYPLVTSKNIVDGRLDISNVNYITEEDYIKINQRSKVDDGDILMPMIGTIGKPIVVKKEFEFAIKNVALIKFHEDSKVLSKYIKYVLDSFLFKQYIEKENRGGTQKFLSLTNIRNFMIPVPNIDTQDKIVRILDKSQSLIHLRKNQIKTLDQLIQSVFIEMFGNPISNSKGWEISICKNVTCKIGSGATPKGGNASYKDSGISLIRSMNVYNNSFSYKDLAFIDDEQAEKLKNVEVCKNDVLLNITGASVARSCIVPTDILPARVNQHVSIIRAKEEVVNYIFFSYLFTNEIYQRYLWQIATSGGATREAITKQQIKKLPVILPPLYLQNDFASKVEQIEKQKSIMQSSIEELENMYNALLQKAFNGSLFNGEKISNLS